MRECVLDGFRPRAGTRTPLRLSGADTARIRVVRSDLRLVEKIAIVDTGAPTTALVRIGETPPPE